MGELVHMSSAPLRTVAPIVLVVEDDEDLRALCCTVMARTGYTMLVARDGEEGLTTFRANAKSIDLVVIDVNLPGISGWDLWREIRAVRGDVAVLFVSGFDAAGGTEAQRSVVASGAELLEKPFTMVRLVAKVKEMLER